MTIARNTMFDPLIETLPAFRPMREAFVEKWTGNPHNHFDAPGNLPEYLLLGDLTRWLLEMLAAGNVEDVRGALAVVERWLQEGDAYVKEAATIGFIETLQNNIEDDGTRKLFFDLLGPEGKHWWRKLDQFWTKGEHPVDDCKGAAEEQSAWSIDKTVNTPLWRAGRNRSRADD